MTGSSDSGTPRALTFMSTLTSPAPRHDPAPPEEQRVETLVPAVTAVDRTLITGHYGHGLHLSQAAVRGYRLHARAGGATVGRARGPVRRPSPWRGRGFIF